ncbi:MULTISPECIES: class I adenylate-forming enzyme family protein [Rhizobium]|uniref:3-methylmercaptopropionyl-CoA ligase n=2 Tax=Rhizobium TaxID=379 RepID=K0Q0V0_9HYPH|nr:MULTISPECIES: class I adenylate-forming enzyme family protein [Rhizobium]KWV43471.1 AMP-dependent synthetase [Rhizobium altiplani]CCM79978.1 AMP-dependent synthetase and ligase [Rhizobium mesoamericanum STM3625]
MEHQTPFSSVYNVLLAAARGRMEKIAIVHEGEAIGYALLLSRIEDVIARLSSLGIGKGDVFAVFGQNHPEQIYCYYAAAKIGAVFVPVNPNLTAPEVAYNFKHSGAKVLFFDDYVKEIARQAVPEDKLLPISELTAEPSIAEHPHARIDVEDDFIITYSSGTTGNQKAVVLDQRCQIGVAASLSTMWGVSDNDVTLVALPLGYIFGLSTAAATALSVGGTVVLLRRFHPRDVLEAFNTYSVTVYHGVPTMFSMMMEYCEQRDLSFDLSNSRLLICSGAPLPEAVSARFEAKFGKPLQNYYALTEVTPVFGRYYDDPTPLPAGAIGRAGPGVTVKIMNPDGTECELGEAGEAYVRGPSTVKRYAKDEAMTAAALQDGLFRTGDLVRQDKDGFYYIVGRIKDIIIRGGHNISPAEVEQTIISHPSVQDAAVVSVLDRIFGEVPIAFVVLRANTVLSPEELIAYLDQKLSDFKVPRTIYFESELPQGKTGKVDKKALKARAEDALAAA